MENETPKQKSIRESWGEVWDRIKDRVDDRGFCNILYVPADFIRKCYSEHTDGPIRPCSISEIEYNNGWIRTDERLPEEWKEIVIVSKLGSTYHQEPGIFKQGKFFGVDKAEVYVTHWRPKEVYPKPIY